MGPGKINFKPNKYTTLPKRILQVCMPYFELCVWVTALLSLVLMHPESEAHLSLCFFKWLGIGFCPGCGLGHSIAWLFQGDVRQSLEAHPAGIFALAVILHRIFTLVKTKWLQLTFIKQSNAINS